MTSGRRMRRLHIGGKERRDQWEIIDALPGEHVDHVGNAADLSRFSDGTFEAVYASHVAEHFGYHSELPCVLREWFRVLRPEGCLYVSVPDLDVLAELFLLRESISASDRFQVMRMIFGGQTNDYDYHRVGLNEEFLRQFLSEAGFVDIQRTESFDFFQDTSSMRFHGIPISCNVRARRPGRQI